MDTPSAPKNFQDASHKEIVEELLKLDIFERFDGDAAWLTQSYDPGLTLQEADELRLALIRVNPVRSVAIAPADILDDLSDPT